RANRGERKCAEWLLKKKLVHFIASDTHSLRGRPPILSEAVGCAFRIVGEEETKALVCRNPEKIINGLDIY
ncbi:MAG: CpsB/CapC family capsule biosynthesis tyrosine phosphatase, partial [Planctomycetota bacterium]